jgi:hypothetical protein
MLKINPDEESEKMKQQLEIVSYFFKGCPGWGANPGPFFISFIFSFHHFTAEPQRLPKKY